MLFQTSKVLQRDNPKFPKNAFCLNLIICATSLHRSNLLPYNFSQQEKIN